MENRRRPLPSLNGINYSMPVTEEPERIPKRILPFIFSGTPIEEDYTENIYHMSLDYVLEHFDEIFRKQNSYSEFNYKVLFETINRAIHPCFQETYKSKFIRNMLSKHMLKWSNGVENNNEQRCLCGINPMFTMSLINKSNSKYISIELYCGESCDYNRTIINLLVKEDTNLDSLEISGTFTLKMGRQLFYSTVYAMINLTELVLKRFANDHMMLIIGRHCINLVLLDVSKSPQVTDDGIVNLLLNKNFDLLYWNKFGSGESISKIDVLLSLERYYNVTSLCSSLEILDIGDTQVTRDGIIFAIINLPQLKSLGENCDLKNTMDSLHNLTLDNSFQLKLVKTSNSNLKQLITICHICPNLETLVVSYPINFQCLQNYITNVLVKLTLNNIPPFKYWMRYIIKYLSESETRALKEVSLKFYPTNWKSTMKLDSILSNLIHLNALEVTGVETILKKDPLLQVSRNLKIINLSRLANLQSLQYLLKLTPVLEVLHVHDCIGLNRHNLLHLFVRVHQTRLEEKFFKHPNCMFFNELTDKRLFLYKNIMFVNKKIFSINNDDILSDNHSELIVLKCKRFDENFFHVELIVNG